MIFGVIEVVFADIGFVELEHEELTGRIRQAAFEVHCYFGPGFLERVYANALANRLRKKGFHVETGRRILVRDEDGTIVGVYVADLVVNGLILLEIKATQLIALEHGAQITNYLRGTNLRIGLLINFGQRRLFVRRFLQRVPNHHQPTL